MSGIGIVTDSTSLIPADLRAENGIRVVSMGYILNNKVYRDHLDIDTADFWKTVYPTFKEPPTTSAGATGDFYRTFMDLAKDHQCIVCITMSRVLSATWGSADQAAKMVKESQPGLDIRVIDSKTCLGALGFVVLEAARAARSGKDLAGVLAVCENMLPRVKYFMILESLRSLMKIGRAPDGKAQDVPQITPIMGMVSGKGTVENLDRAATLNEALAKAVEMVGKYTDSSKPLHVLLNYPQTPEKTEEMKKSLLSRYHCAEIYTAPCTPATVVATGPMWAMGFYC
jgi:DegV family protein with EDD domain